MICLLPAAKYYLGYCNCINIIIKGYDACDLSNLGKHITILEASFAMSLTLHGQKYVRLEPLWRSI